jgi:hypothetical protein
MEEDQESGKSDNDDVAQRLVPTVFENKPDDIMTLAMQIEKHNSLTQLWDLNQSEHERVQNLVERIAPYEFNTGVVN